jgi:formate dehydrogenase iron-sulfur subunit
MIVGPSRAHPFTQTVTTACHHCADPACLNGCPVLAYEKDPITGIVVHLDDQCIGCSYCILKCPYDVPKFSERLGIVRKCDMCHSRLAEGEAPACAQACPTHAIRIVTVSTKRTRAVENRKPETGCATSGGGRLCPPGADAGRQGRLPPLDPVVPVSNGFLPGAPDPSYTQPTTRYITKRKLPLDLAAADAATLRPQPPHWPLVALLLFMPMAVGCGIADKILSLPTPALTVIGWLSGATGLAFSVLHLGQPLRAWRIFLGLRRSWLSREAVVFGAWFPLATTYALVRLDWLPVFPEAFRSPLAVATATLGVLGLFCSVMIYVDTRRAFWRFAYTAPRFFGTALILALGSVLVSPGAPASIPAILIGATIAKLLFEARALDAINGDRDELTPARKTALLLAGPLRWVNELRIFAALVGGVLIPLMVALGQIGVAFAWPALVALAFGELLERSLYFRAVDAPKMPGVPA